MKCCDPVSLSESGGKPPGSPVSSLSADQASCSPLLPLSSADLSQGDIGQEEEVGPAGSPNTSDAQAKQLPTEPAPATFVPFSGGGHRLGGPPGSVRPAVSSSAKLPKSFYSLGGPSKPKKLKPGQEPSREPEQVRDMPAWGRVGLFSWPVTLQASEQCGLRTPIPCFFSLGERELQLVQTQRWFCTYP